MLVYLPFGLDQARGWQQFLLLPLIVARHPCAADFFERISLVKIRGEDGNKLWPTLKFDSISKLQDLVKYDLNVPAADLARLQQNIFQRGHTVRGSSGIAYLLGRGVPLANECLVHNFYSLIHEINGKADNQGDAEFQKA